MPNEWCEVLGIETPTLEAVAHHAEANTYARLIVALLERGEPMTLAQVAARFEEAGIADEASALQSLKRCKPGRAPLYREGNRYHLNPHDQDLDLWAFRLGLRPPKRPRVKAKPEPLPGPEVPLTDAELDEGWTDASLYSWSASRLVLAVLDASQAPLAPGDAVAAVKRRTEHCRLHDGSDTFKLEVLEDGRWAIAEGADEALRKSRVAVRARIATTRKYRGTRSSPAEVEAALAGYRRERAARGAELASQTRALVVAFPPRRPEVASLLDVQAHTITTFVGEELDGLRARLADSRSSAPSRCARS